MRESSQWTRALSISLLTLAILAGLLVDVRECLVEPIWLDETYSLVAAREHLSSLFRYWILPDVHPPLYYLVAYAVLHVINDDLTLRFFSLLFFAALGAVYLARLLTARSTLTEALIVVASSAALAQFAESRAYAMLYVGSVLAVRWCHDIQIGARSSPWFQISVIFVAGCSALLHYFGYFVFAYVACQLIVIRRPVDKRTAAAAVIFALMLAGWLLLQVSSLQAKTHNLWIPKLDLVDSLHVMLFTIGNRWQVMAVAALACLALAGLGSAARFVRFGWAIWASFVLLVVLVNRFVPVVVPRYFLPLVAILLILIIDTLRFRQPGPAAQIGVPVATALYLFGAAADGHELWIATQKPLSWKAQTEWVNARNDAAQPVYFLLDDPLAPQLSDYQYDHLANAFNHGPHIVPLVQAGRSPNWIEDFVAANREQEFFLMKTTANRTLWPNNLDAIWSKLEASDCYRSGPKQNDSIACRIKMP